MGGRGGGAGMVVMGGHPPEHGWVRLHRQQLKDREAATGSELAHDAERNDHHRQVRPGVCAVYKPISRDRTLSHSHNPVSRDRTLSHLHKPVSRDRTLSQPFTQTSQP